MSSDIDDTGGTPVRPFLPGFVEVVPMGPDCLQIRTSGRVVTLRSSGMAESTARLLHACDGRETRDQLADRLEIDRATLTTTLQGLARVGLVRDGPTDDPPAPQLAEVYAELGERADEVRAALATSAVVVVGAGPVAAAAAASLCRAGLGRLVLDEPVAEECERLAPAGTIVTSGAGADPAGVDLAVVQVDDPLLHDDPAAGALDVAGVPMLPHRTRGLRAFVGPITGGGRRPCPDCLQARRDSHCLWAAEDDAYVAAVAAGAARALQPVTAPSLASIVGGLVASYAIAYLVPTAIRVEPGHAYFVDLTTLTVRRELALALPGCRRCWTETVDLGADRDGGLAASRTHQ